MKNITGLALCIVLATFSSQAVGESYGLLYKTKRLLGPSSVEQLAKMSQFEKDKELRFYTQQEVDPVPSALKAGIWMALRSKKWFVCRTGWVDFTPNGKYLKDIIYLVKNGASPNCDIPYQWGHYNYKEIRGSGTFKPIYLFLAMHDEEGVRVLLEHGASLDNVIQSNGNIGDPLSFAKTPSMAKLLLDHGAKISSVINRKFSLSGMVSTDELIKFRSLIEVLASPDSDAQLIALYLSCYEGNVAEFAQVLWEQLARECSCYHSNRELFHKKRDCLKNAGALYDTQWEDEKFIWKGIWVLKEIQCPVSCA
jgi:hypothetical protein